VGKEEEAFTGGSTGKKLKQGEAKEGGNKKRQQRKRREKGR